MLIKSDDIVTINMDSICKVDSFFLTNTIITLHLYSYARRIELCDDSIINIFEKNNSNHIIFKSRNQNSWKKKCKNTILWLIFSLFGTLQLTRTILYLNLYHTGQKFHHIILKTNKMPRALHLMLIKKIHIEKMANVNQYRT